MISRSLHVPGSPSSALTTRYRGLQGRRGVGMGRGRGREGVSAHLGSFSRPGLFMELYLKPLGKPAPPRSRRPEFLIVSMIQLSPLRFVLCQSLRD